ncbi:unnamed protein product [Closterium sp. NIES-54]
MRQPAAYQPCTLPLLLSLKLAPSPILRPPLPLTFPSSPLALPPSLLPPTPRPLSPHRAPAIISELHRRLNPSKATNIPAAAPADSAAASAAAASAPGAYASAIGGGSGSNAGGTSSSGGGGVAEGVAEVVGHVGERGVAEGQAEEELDEETRWRRWVDGHLVHLLSPNIYRSPSEALEAFDYIATNGNFTAWERMMARYFGAGAMYVIGKKLKKKHGIADERADLYKAADEWVAALGDRKFLGGKTPNLADLAVFGVLRPIRHLTAGRDMVANSSIGPWYERMEEHVGASARITAVEGAAVGKITAADGASADGATGVGAAGKIAAADGAAANGAAMGNGCLCQDADGAAADSVAAGGAAAGGVPAGGATAHGAAVSQGHGAAAEQ